MALKRPSGPPDDWPPEAAEPLYEDLEREHPPRKAKLDARWLLHLACLTVSGRLTGDGEPTIAHTTEVCKIMLVRRQSNEPG